MIVAVLEDCPAQRDWVTKLLHDRGHQVVARGDGDSFIALLRSQVVDAALLDWEVPGASGLSVLSWARSNLNRSMPILMLTQRDDEDDVVTALNAGADDYLHAAARARAAGARGRAGQAFPPCRCAGAGAAGRPLCVRPAIAQADRARAARQPARARVRAGGIAVPQPRPDPDQDALCQHIWGTVDRKYDASLATYISNLRSALGLRSRNGYVVSTVYNYGYRLERVA